MRKKKKSTRTVYFIMGNAFMTDVTSTLSPLIEVIVRRGRSTRKALKAFKLPALPSSSTPAVTILPISTFSNSYASVK
jgi:hypothetical protein